MRECRPQIASHVRLANLEERITPLPQDYTAISILKPAIYIERDTETKSSLLHAGSRETHFDEDGPVEVEFTDGEGESWRRWRSRDHGHSPREVFRINASFTLEVEIPTFDEDFQKFNRFFDSVSLRWLLRDGERYETTPRSQRIDSQDRACEPIDTTSSCSDIASAAPSAQVHVQGGQTLAVERKTKSWRRGVTVEAYPPIRDSSTQKYCAQLTKLCQSPRSRAFFGVFPSPRFHKRHECHPQGWNCRYDSCVYWAWQTNIGRSLWTPDLYQCISLPVTITRVVEVGKIEELFRKGRHRELDRYLHFDFTAEVRVRELGRCVNFFTRSAVPPDIRFKKDSGEPLPADLYAFCVACRGDDRTLWPRFRTPNLRQVATLFCKT
ncbi:hypothetical protein EJ06DRAFT_345557 [Trichodelitschia bisporula]|uniref:Uncharacterized protein n=1 Tax=Trichodelitschia bisporula TaxID=703511 RepID=A0A6G1I2N3_9PEZI|nr:hypothetical protein EJ06DRAFT_345557 [Trichodelitschia bisporula]